MSAPRDWNVDCKVYVGEIGYGAAKQELEDIFSEYGPLKNVWVARNPPGFAFVEFEDHRDARDAVDALDGTLVFFIILYIKCWWYKELFIHLYTFLFSLQVGINRILNYISCLNSTVVLMDGVQELRCPQASRDGVVVGLPQ